MTKKELIKVMATSSGYDRKAIENIINGFLTEIDEITKNGGSISLPKFGKFYGKMTSPRKIIFGDNKGSMSEPRIVVKFKKYD